MLWPVALAVCGVPAVSPLSQGVAIPIEIIERSGYAAHSAPITGGVPVKKGMARPTDRWRLLDEQGRDLPVQVTVLNTWRDGSVKWLVVDTQADLTANQRRSLRLVLGDGAVPPVAVRVEDEKDAWRVHTGPLSFKVSKTRFRLLEEVRLHSPAQPEGILLTRPSEGGLAIRDVLDTDYLSANDTQTYSVYLEEAGPLRAVLKAQGMHRDRAGHPKFAFVVRIHAYAGQPFVKVSHRVVVSGKPNQEFMKFIELETPLNYTGDKPRRLSIGDDNGNTLADTFSFGGSTKMAKIAEIKGKPDPITRGATPFVGQYAHDQWVANYFGRQMIADGKRSPGWLDCRQGDRGLMVTIADFWKLYPKELSFDLGQNLLRADVWPRHTPNVGVLNLARGREGSLYYEAPAGDAAGVSFATDLYYHFHRGDLDAPNERAKLYDRMPVLQTTPQWFKETGVFGPLYTVQDAQKYPKYEALIAAAIGWIIGQTAKWNFYGMFNYGDITRGYSDGQQKPIDYGGNAWLNNEFDGAQSLWLQYTRTGDPTLRDAAIAHSRHAMGLDFVSPCELKARDVWTHTEQTGLVRRHVERHFVGHADHEHVFTRYQLWYSYLTGDRWGLDCLAAAGERMLSHPMKGSLRALGNKFGTCVDAYEASRDERFLRKAHEYLDVLLDGQNQDGSWGIGYGGPDRGFLQMDKAFRQNVRHGGPTGAYMQYVLHEVSRYLELMEDAAHREAELKQSYVRAAEWLLREAESSGNFQLNWSLHHNGSTPEHWAYGYLWSGNRKLLDAARKYVDLRVAEEAANRTFGDLKPGSSTAAVCMSQAYPYFLGALDLSTRKPNISSGK